MGTRTYSRRGAGGVRVPTALGIRTGRFTATAENQALGLDDVINNTGDTRIEMKGERDFRFDNIEDEVNFGNTPKRQIEEVANTVRLLASMLNEDTPFDAPTTTAVASALKNMWELTRRAQRSVNNGYTQFDNQDLSEDARERAWQRSMTSVASDMEEMERLLRFALPEYLMTDELPPQIRSGNVANNVTQSYARQAQRFYNIADRLGDARDYFIDGLESGFYDV